jgi:DNA-binding transcriptional ArsR family regulator
MKDKSLLAEILSSQVRAEIFRLLFDSHAPEIHMREIERQSDLAIGTIQQDLKKLAGLHLITSRKDGNRVYYRANANHPLFHEIMNLVTKTTGAVPLLKEALTSEKVTLQEIQVAFIFGSIARNEEKATSDIDVMIIGEIGPRKISNLLVGLTEKLGREINPHVLSPGNFKTRISQKDHFISQVMGTKKLFIIGSENELEAMGR